MALLRFEVFIDEQHRILIISPDRETTRDQLLLFNYRLLLNNQITIEVAREVNQKIGEWFDYPHHYTQVKACRIYGV